MQEQLFTVEGMDQFIPADRSVPRVREDFNGCRSRMDTHFDTALNRSAAIVFEAAAKQMTVNPLIGAGKLGLCLNVYTIRKSYRGWLISFFLYINQNFLTAKRLICAI